MNICEYELQQVCRTSVKRYHFVLLDDALVYGHVVSSNSGAHHHSKTTSYKLHRMIDDLSECKVHVLDKALFPLSLLNDKSDLKGAAQTSFYFLSPAKSFVLIASDTKSRDAWISHLRHCIDSIKSKRASSSTYGYVRTRAVFINLIT